MSLINANYNLLNVSKRLIRLDWQSVRYNLRHKRKEPLRKPIWQPTAPSKLYQIKKKPQLSEEETAQRKHLTDVYEINMKSIQKFLKDEFYTPTLEAGGRSPEEVAEEEMEQQKLLEENEQENERIAKMRDERLKVFQADKEAILLAKSIAIEEENKRLGEQFDIMVRKEIERSKTYITKENLDSKIEECLTHQTTYDFAIDNNGKLVFSGSLHPYALSPKDVPETSSNIDEYKETDSSKPIYVKAKRLF
ncbi:hormone [Blomia tropicalis]|nr:hormone [Blomia tropicalis]